MWHRSKILCCALVLASYDALSQRFQPVSAGQEFKGSYINIRVPNSEGWQMVRSSASGMEFAKPTGRGENLSAQVLMFGLAPTKTPEDFVTLIKRGIAQDTDSIRFDVLSSSSEYSSERGYPCVRYSAAVRDKEAQTSPSTREALLLETEALYCRHPVRDTTGFAAIYSHRGRASHSPLKSEAVDFINGIQVPEGGR
jgi:hypothetical protein